MISPADPNSLPSVLLFQRHLSRPKPMGPAVLFAQQQGAFVIETRHHALVSPPPFQERDRLAAQDVVTVPEIRERLEVLALDKDLIREQHAPNQRGGETVEVERLSGDFLERN